MATVNFLFRSSKTIAPLNLRLLFRNSDGDDITIGGKTKLLVDKQLWSKRGKRNKEAEIKEKLNIIDAELLNIESFIIESYNNDLKTSTIDKVWLTDTIEQYYTPPQVETQKSDLLIDAIQDVINNAPTRKNSKQGIGISESRIKSYEQLKTVITKFSKRNKYKVKDVNIAFAKKFLNWLMLDQKYSKGYALKSIDNLKAVCKDANIQGIETSTQLQNIEGGRVKNDYVIYLTPQELDKIETKELTKQSLINARKWLILGCNIGQRGGDLLNITNENFKTVGKLNVIELQQQKTDKIVLIPVNKKVQEIYNHGLPHKISIQRFNDFLKELCKVCEIDTPTKGAVYQMTEHGKRKVVDTYPKHELITSHVCRRTFCSNYYGKMPTNLIMQISGHSTEKMLLTYIGKKSADYLQEIANYFMLEEQRNHKETNLNIVKSAVNQ